MLWTENIYSFVWIQISNLQWATQWSSSNEWDGTNSSEIKGTSFLFSFDILIYEIYVVFCLQLAACKAISLVVFSRNVIVAPSMC